MFTASPLAVEESDDDVAASVELLVDELSVVAVLELLDESLLDESLEVEAESDDELPQPASIDAVIAPVKSNATCFFIFIIMKTLPIYYFLCFYPTQLGISLLHWVETN
jgi:hypothetical protein